MTPTYAVFLLSTTGSTALFLAGVSAGRLLPRRAEGRGTELEAARAAREHLEAGYVALQAELATARATAADSEQALAAERQRTAAATQRVGELEAQLAPMSDLQALEAEVQRLRGLVAEASAAKTATATAGTEGHEPGGKSSQELAKVRQELATERATRTRRDTELRKLKDEHAELERKLEAKQQVAEHRTEASASAETLKELARLQKVLLDTQQELERLKAARAAEPKAGGGEAERERVKNKQLTVELEREQSQRKKLAAELEAERAQHKHDQAELDHLRKRVEEVTSEKEDLEVRQEASGAYVRRAQDEAKKLRAEVAAVQQELADARAAVGSRDVLDQALERGRESATQLVKLRQELNEALRQAKAGAAAQERAATLEQTLGELRTAAVSQADELRARVATLEQELERARASAVTPERPATDPGADERPAAAVGEAELRELKLRLGHAEARVALVATLEAENRGLKDELEELRPRASEATELRQRVTKLESRLFAIGEKSSPTAALPPIDASAYPTPAATQNTLLGLLEAERSRAVVLADGHGLPVGAEGDRDTHEGLAAVTGLAGHLAKQARQLLPLAAVSTVSFADENALIVSCRLFDCHGDDMALATLGTSVPAPSIIERVVAAIRESMAQPPSSATVG